MERVKITESEVLRAILDAQTPNAPTDAFTSEEICTATGRGRDYVRARIRELVRAGVLECVKKPATDVTGRSVALPAYRAK